jgi:shikimate 5-dehydrogenase
MGIYEVRLGVDVVARDSGRRITMQVRERDPLSAAIKAEELADNFNQQRDFPPDVCPLRNMDEVAKELRRSTILVNATTVGMSKGEPPVRLKDIEPGKSLNVYDVVYNRRTELLEDAEACGMKCSGGIGMLARQGAEAFKWWNRALGKSVEAVSETVIENMKDYLKKEVNSR